MNAQRFAIATEAGHLFGLDQAAVVAALRQLADDFESGKIHVTDCTTSGRASAEDFPSGSFAVSWARSKD